MSVSGATFDVLCKLITSYADNNMLLFLTVKE